MTFLLGTSKVSDRCRNQGEEAEGQQIAQILEPILLGEYGLLTTFRSVLAQESSHLSQRHAQQISCGTLLRHFLRVWVVLWQINLSVERENH